MRRYDWNRRVEHLGQGTFGAAAVVACAHPLIVIVTGVPAPSWVPLLLGCLMALNLACLAAPLWRRGPEPGRAARPLFLFRLGTLLWIGGLGSLIAALS